MSRKQITRQEDAVKDTTSTSFSKRVYKPPKSEEPSTKTATKPKCNVLMNHDTNNLSKEINTSNFYNHDCMNACGGTGSAHSTSIMGAETLNNTEPKLEPNDTTPPKATTTRHNRKPIPKHTTKPVTKHLGKISVKTVNYKFRRKTK